MLLDTVPTMKETQEAYAGLLSQAREILNTAQSAGRGLTEEESLQVENLTTAAKAMRAPDGGPLSGRRTEPVHPGGDIGDSPTADYFRTSDGKMVRALAQGESFRAAVCPGKPAESLCIGEAVLGWATGNHENLSPRMVNLMQESNDTTGGYAVPSELASYIIDLARNKSVMMKAGAKTIPMRTEEMRITRVASDPVAYWRHEGTPIPTSDMTFDQLTLRAKTLAVLVGVTIELSFDSSNAAMKIQEAIASAIALEFDRSILRGSGAGAEPVGIRNEPACNFSDLSTSLWDFDDWIDSIESVHLANGNPNGVVLSPATQARASKLKDGEGQYLVPPPAVKDLPWHVSNQVPSNLGAGSNETEIYIGDFSKVLMGVRNSFTLEVFKSGTVNSQDAVESMLIWVRGYLRADTHIERPDHITCIHGAINSP